MEKLILASGSPRRKEILLNAGLTFEIVTSDADESYDNSFSCEEIVKSLAFKKANAVAQSYNNAIIIGADTIVYYDGKILGKPTNEYNAKEMLRMLSGNTHSVLTGYALIRTSDYKTKVDYDITKVTFRKISDEEIEEYIKSGEPLDKAGSYAIQGGGGAFVNGIEGDFDNVVGLPIAKILKCLNEDFKYNF